jgi:uncharacterized protein YggE
MATGMALLCLLPCAAFEAAAQDEQKRDPQVITSGTADETIPATTASFSIDVASLGASAAAASAKSARAAGAVTTALEAARLSRNEIAQSQLTVAPRWNYDPTTQRQKLAGYEATTIIQIETDRLERLGAYMDAALGAGATGISMVSFSAKNSNEARRRALVQAVSQARTDAETIARAGGGTLGQLVLLTTEPQNTPRGVEISPFSVAASRSVPEERTNIIPSQIKVTATVVGHWRFVAGKGSP